MKKQFDKTVLIGRTEQLVHALGGGPQGDHGRHGHGEYAVILGFRHTLSLDLLAYSKGMSGRGIE